MRAPQRSEVVLLVLVVVVAIVVGANVTRPQGPILCTMSGSPYLDDGVPDECEIGQLPQFLGTMPPEYVEYYQNHDPQLYKEIMQKYGY